MHLCLIVFVFHLAKYISLGAFGSFVSLSCLESETGLKEVCVDLHDHRNQNSPSHKSCSSIIGSLFYSVELEIVVFFLFFL